MTVVTHRLRRPVTRLLIAAALLPAACGTSTKPTAKADQTTTTAAAPASSAAATTAATAVAPPAKPLVSFKKTIQPIIENSCSSCHQAGGIGASDALMATAADAAKMASTIGKVTQSGYMPPWPASAKGIPLADTRRLSDADLAAVLEWSNAGAPLDVDGATPVKPVPVDPANAVRPDLTVRMPSPYAGDLSVKDEYQCFILEPAMPKKGYIVGSQFFPDDLGSVHHVIVTRHSAAERAAAEKHDAEDPAVGWSCPAGMGGLRGEGGGVGSGWVPGQRPRKFADGLGIEFNPGDFIVAQLHYHHGDANHAGVLEKGTDQSSMVFEFAPDGATITPVRSRTLLGPMELPCPGGSTEPLCDRTAAIADVVERFGPTGGAIPGALAKACGTTPEELAAISDGQTAKTTCNYKITEDATVVSFMGHMHEIGASFRMTLNPGTNREKVLLDIPDWDFAWQLTYEPASPIEVAKGDDIRIECTWDRATDPSRPLRYVLWAEGTEDEMCFSTLSTYKKP
jgi:mono/diheme cytochrome c family protein